MRTYADFRALVLATQPIDPTDTSIQLSPHDALLQQLGLIVIGEHEGTQRIEVYATEMRKSHTLHDIDKLTYAKLVALCGSEKVEELVHDGNKAPAGQVLIKDVRVAIASAAADKVYNREQKLGAGIHEIDSKIVLVKAQEYGLVNCQKIDRSREPFVGRRMIDISRGSKDWCDLDVVQSYLVAAQVQKWRMEVFEQAEAIFAKWFWKYPPSPTVVAAMVIATWLQSLWRFRPEIAVTGPTSSGKSDLMCDVLQPLFGQMGFFSAEANEAGIRQQVKHSMMAILVDEFEDSKKRREVMNMFRNSGKGIHIYRGTRDHGGTSFLIKHIPWFGSIETGAHQEQDANRFMMLELNQIPLARKNKITLPTVEQLNELGLKLLGVGLAVQAAARELYKTLRTQQTDKVAGRLVELFSVPCSIISTVYGHSVEEAVAYQAAVLGSWDFESQQVNSAVSLLSEIFSTEVWLEGGKKSTINQLIHEADSKVVGTAIDTDAVLHRYGISRTTRKDGNRVIFFNVDFIRKTLLKPGSDFAGQSIRTHLMRIEGAEAGRHRLGGSKALHGVTITVDSIEKLFGECEDTQSASEF